MRSDYTAEPTVVFLKTHGSGYATMQRTNAPRNISPRPSSNFFFQRNCTLDEKKERKINRPNVSEGCVTHCPSVNSQLIRCGAVRHQKVSRRRRGWPARVKCSSHDRTFHSVGGEDGRQISVNTKPTNKQTLEVEVTRRDRDQSHSATPVKCKASTLSLVQCGHKTKKHWFWQVLFHERLIQTPNLHISRNPWFNLQYCRWKKRGKKNLCSTRWWQEERQRGERR